MVSSKIDSAFSLNLRILEVEIVQKRKDEVSQWKLRTQSFVMRGIGFPQPRILVAHAQTFSDEWLQGTHLWHASICTTSIFEHVGWTSITTFSYISQVYPMSKLDLFSMASVLCIETYFILFIHHPSKDPFIFKANCLLQWSYISKVPFVLKLNLFCLSIIQVMIH